MPNFACAYDSISSNELCGDNPGLLTVFWIDKTKIDWAAMALVANWDDATYSVKNWVLLGGATWGEISFTRRNGRLDALYTEANGYYEVNLLNMLLRGHSSSRSVSIGKAIGCCGLVLQVHDNNSKARVIGQEFVGGAWVDALKNGKISRHLDTTGAYGNEEDKARDEFDITAQHSFPLPYSDVTISTMRGL